jgi:hypothetical protein
MALFYGAYTSLSNVAFLNFVRTIYEGRLDRGAFSNPNNSINPNVHEDYSREPGISENILLPGAQHGLHACPDALRRLDE